MIEPVLYRVLVKPHDIFVEDPSYAAAKRMGLTVAGEKIDREQKGVDRGVVLTLGPTVDPDLKVVAGDTVVWARHAGKEVEDPETKEKFVLLNDEDIVAIIRS